MATVVTKTIKPAGGGDYTTLQAALDANAANLVTADRILRLECYGGNAGGGDVTSAYVTDATRYIHIVASTEARHAGVWDSLTKARCEHALSSRATVRAASGRIVLLDGMQVANGSTEAAVRGAVATDVICVGCLLRSPFACAVAATCYSCVAIPSSTSANGFVACHTYGCTVAAASTGYGYASSHVAKNCIAQNCTDGFSGTFSADSDYNVSDIAGDAPGTHSKTGVVAFVDAAAKDYHLAAADTVARGAGVNLTASGITTDIDGDARPATGAWDIGADQVVESPTPTPGGGRKPWGRDPWGRTAWGRAAWGRAG